MPMLTITVVPPHHAHSLQLDKTCQAHDLCCQSAQHGLRVADIAKGMGIQCDHLRADLCEEYMSVVVQC